MNHQNLYRVRPLIVHAEQYLGTPISGVATNENGHYVNGILVEVNDYIVQHLGERSGNIDAVSPEDFKKFFEPIPYLDDHRIKDEDDCLYDNSHDVERQILYNNYMSLLKLVNDFIIGEKDIKNMKVDLEHAGWSYASNPPKAITKLQERLIK